MGEGIPSNTIIEPRVMALDLLLRTEGSDVKWLHCDKVIVSNSSIMDAINLIFGIKMQ